MKQDFEPKKENFQTEEPQEMFDNDKYFDKSLEDILLGQPQFIFDTPPAFWTGPLYYKLGDHSRAIWLSGFLIVAGALLYWIDQSLSTSILMLLLAIVVFVYSKKEPPIVEFEVTPRKIRVHNKVYSYNDIKSFWIDYHPNLDVHELSLHLKEWHKPHLKIPLQAQNPSHIRSLLLEFIPEEEHFHTWPEHLMRSMGL